MFSPRDHHTDPETGITAAAGVKVTEYYTTLAHQGEYRFLMRQQNGKSVWYYTSDHYQTYYRIVD